MKRFTLQQVGAKKERKVGAGFRSFFAPRISGLDSRHTSSERRAKMQRKPDETSPRERKAPVAPPGVAWQSRLNPHIDAVWAWRKDGKTLEEIVQLLKLEKGVTVALSTLHTFIESRKRRAAKLALPDLHAKPSPAPVTPAPKGTTKAQEPAPAAAPLPAPGPAPKPRTFDPQTDNNGFPLTGRSEVIGRDHAGRPLTRNRPFKGQV